MTNLTLLCCALLPLLTTTIGAFTVAKTGERRQSMFDNLLSLARDQNRKSGHPLQKELASLQNEDLAFQQTQQRMLESQDGKRIELKTERDTLSDPSTGKLLAVLTKSVNKTDGKTNGKIMLDIPSAGIHKETGKVDDGGFQVVPVADLAKYVYDTSDMDSVKAIIAALVKDGTITADEAAKYFDAIREQLIVMHQHLLKDLKMMEISHEKPKTTTTTTNEALSQVVVLTEVIVSADKAKQKLFNSLKELYALYMRDSQQAYEVLRQYITFVQTEFEENRISKEAHQDIFAIVGKAFKEATVGVEPQKKEKI